MNSKVKSPKQLAAVLKKTRKAVVFTNGCFDILHLGHVVYLQKAQKQGDLLVVALNSDASVKRLKGNERPLNPLRDRMEVLAALECVDFVTWFEEDDPIQLIRLLKPQVLVKGGDWKPDQILGSKDVKSWGGTVKSLAFVKGRSTTKIIEKARLRNS